MGMFDDITCQYPLPVPGANKLKFQSKDTPNQALDHYEIHADGTLWHRDYEIEDRGDKSAPNGDMRRWLGSMTRVNERWGPVEDFTGELYFYTSWGPHDLGWLEFKADFINGKLTQLKTVEAHRGPLNDEGDEQVVI